MEDASACTGISFKAKDGGKVVGRTMEWGGFYMESHLMVVPRGYTRWGQTPSGEKGLMGELFYFPGGATRSTTPS